MKRRIKEGIKVSIEGVEYKRCFPLVTPGMEFCENGLQSFVVLKNQKCIGQSSKIWPLNKSLQVCVGKFLGHSQWYHRFVELRLLIHNKTVTSFYFIICFPQSMAAHFLYLSTKSTYSSTSTIHVTMSITFGNSIRPKIRIVQWEFCAVSILTPVEKALTFIMCILLIIKGVSK